jgi:putative ABC transport system permease protein
MPFLRNIVTGLRSLFRKEQVSHELDEELNGFLEMAAEEKMKEGMSRKEAIRAVRLERGNLEVTKEVVRSAGWESFVETCWQDLRFAARMLRKNPGFTAVAVVTLALGIGANTAIFSIMNATLFRPLPYRNANEIVVVWGTQSGAGANRFSAPDFLDVKDQNIVFENVGAFGLVDFSTFTGQGSPERVNGGSATADFFRVLGVEPVLGRTFLPEEERLGRDHVVVLGYNVWRQRFGSDPNIVGQTIHLDAEPYTVVGVLPSQFQFSISDYYRPRDLWIPLVLPRSESQRGKNYLNVIARLKSRTALRSAQADVDTIGARLAAEYPKVIPGFGMKLVPLHEQIVGEMRAVLWILFGAVAFVLLIACTNVANLQLARASARQKEIVLRKALGASRGRIVRQLVTESVLLALIGGALGVILGAGAIKLFAGLKPLDALHGAVVTVDSAVFGFSLILSLVTGILFGLAPAFQSTSIGLAESLKQAGRTSASAASGPRLRKLLAVTEVALSMVLLIGAGLLIRSFVRLLDVKPGFDPRNILTFPIELPRYSYPDSARQSAFYARAMEAVRGLPGVIAVGAINDLPLTGDSDADGFSIEGSSPTDAINLPSAQDRLVTPDYFQAMGIPLVAGRTFTEADTIGAPPVVLINQSLARQLFADKDPIGQRLKFGPPTASTPWKTIVGVVGDVRHFGLNIQPSIEIYTPYQQDSLPYNPLNYMNFVVRTAAEPNGLANAVLRQIEDVDKELPLPAARTMETVYATSISERRFNVLLLGLFAGLALILATVGIYGVISYSVVRQTHDIGVRLALGASRQEILQLILREGLTLALIGVLIGLAGAFVATRVLSAMLYEVAATDAPTFLGMGLMLLLVTLLATYVPARRAVRVDPMVALRYE